MAAGQQPSREMTTVWMVQPAEPTAGELEVKARDLILKQKLLPSGLAQLTDSFQDAGGKRSLGSGTQLFEVKSDVPIYCVAGLREPGGFEKFMTGGASRQFCLIDMDSDRRFDAYFETGSMVPGLPTIAGKRPKKPKAMSPVGYEVVEPSTIEKSFWIGIEYQGKPLIYDRRNFAISFGSESGKGSMTDWVYTSGSAYPLTKQLLGASFTVLGVNGDKLKVRIDQPMPPQPFGVVHSVSYRFY
jgi:hypothetical protein